MLRPIRDAALLLTLCGPIVIQQLVWALAIDKSPLESQSIEPRRQFKSTISNKSASEHSSQNEPPEASSSVGRNSWPDTRRPVWNMAHMVNSIKELDYRLAKGANAVEVDVTFGKDGDPLYTYHGPPCDCWRHCHQQEDFNEYLRYVREITMEDPNGIGQNMTLLFLDLKLDHLDHKGKTRAGSELAKSVINNLFPIRNKDDFDTELKMNAADNRTAAGRQPIIALILSINHVTDIELVHNFLHQLELNNSLNLMPRIGFDVGMNDDVQLIESMWKRFGKQLNLWQGDGFTNCFSPFYNLERLSKALTRRNQETGYPRKVYQWTIDLHDRMRDSLQMGVDGIMTNHPERLVAIMQEPELVRNFRLATRDDNPFKRIPYQRSLRGGESARYQRSAGQTNGGFFGNIMDILSSWFTWIREIPYLSLPTTSRFLPSSPKQRQKQAAERRTRPTGMGDDEKLAKSTGPESTLITKSSEQPRAASLVDKSDSSDGTDGQGTTIPPGPTTSNSSDPTPPPYEGPKWYTSLASKLLVSAMKVALPVNNSK